MRLEVKHTKALCPHPLVQGRWLPEGTHDREGGSRLIRVLPRSARPASGTGVAQTAYSVNERVARNTIAFTIKERPRLAPQPDGTSAPSGKDSGVDSHCRGTS